MDPWSEAALLGRDTSAVPPGPADRLWDLILLDRDGTLNRLRPGYVSVPEELDVLPGAAEAVARLRSTGARIFVLTNQRGVATGAVTWSQLADVHRRLIADLAAGGASLDGIHVCGHEEFTCDCRKPAPGLVHQAFDRAPWADPAKTVLVGDSDRDEGAAKAAGIRSVRIADSSIGLAEKVEDLLLFFRRTANNRC